MKKVGYWLPSRKNYVREQSEWDSWFLDALTSSIITGLKKSIKGEIINIPNFREAYVENGKVYVDKLCLNDLDVFLWCADVSMRPLSFFLDVMKTLAYDVKVVNSPYAVELCVDKYKVQTLLRRQGVKVPANLLMHYKTWRTASHENVKKFKNKYKEVLLKPRSGGAGKGIVKLNDSQTIKDIMEYSGRVNHFIEEYIPHKFENFTGVNVVNGKVIHGYTKEDDYIVGGWKPYANRPGGMVLKNITKEEKRIALKVAKIVKLDFFGVDMITDNKGNTYVVDVNTYPGIYPEIISKLPIDVAAEFVNCVKKKL